MKESVLLLVHVAPSLDSQQHHQNSNNCHDYLASFAMSLDNLGTFIKVKTSWSLLATLYFIQFGWKF